mmetsp:Transcript_63997/g.139111  ORF Transcript_63997/g.139111 Transcript_63997/m.139111 type:complete len:112 (+) Transcript_63997:412-747(+)
MKTQFHNESCTSSNTRGPRILEVSQWQERKDQQSAAAELGAVKEICTVEVGLVKPTPFLNRRHIRGDWMRMAIAEGCATTNIAAARNPSTEKQCNAGDIPALLCKMGSAGN